MTCTYSRHVPAQSLQVQARRRGIDWVICMCCQRSWNVSRNLCWWMRLWLSSQPVRARVGAGNTLTASRLPAWHWNRWMPLIVTVCNVFSSIIPFLSLSFSHTTSLSLARGGSLMKVWVVRGAVLYVSTHSGRDGHDFIYHTGRTFTCSAGWNNYDIRQLTL